MKLSWQAKCLNVWLRLFVKPKFRRLVMESSPEKLQKIINKTRQALDGITFPLPADSVTSSININKYLTAKWISLKDQSTETIILYFHGGGFMVGSSSLYADFGYRLAKACAAKVLIFDYRLAPEYELKCAFADSFSAYQYLLANNIKANNIIFAGDSAGGALLLSTLITANEQHYPLPKAAILLSPWLDFTFSGNSIKANAQHDPFIVIPQRLTHFGNIDPKDPKLSPLFADLTNLPPIFIQVSDSEVLLDDATRLTEKAKRSQVKAEIEIWKGLPHCWQLFAKILPEGEQALDHIGNFAKHLDTIN